MSTDISIDTERGASAAHLALPEGTGRYPGLVLIEEVWGVDAHIKDVAERFAREGFIVLAPELLPEGVLATMTPQVKLDLFDPEKREKVQPILREAMAPISQPDFAAGAIAKLRACVDYLVAHAQSNGKVGSLGFCFGGSYSLHLAMNDPRLDACVVFYGMPPEPVDQVASIACPVLMFNGEKDERIIAKLPEFEAAMKEHDQEFESIVYPGVGHAFFNDTNPRSYNEKAARGAWDKSLAFLHKYLEE
ncbi:MAG TPA: dienelactone hydrolase family protein [Candidatus Paceibacterota bacterium]|jgi:carboxymethylenebutenolidase|nr:dienelactone hydrolase family protein [Candidatus Paceibacterota bacterium]